MIFDYYLSGASFGKVADMLSVKDISSLPGRNAERKQQSISLVQRKVYPIVEAATYMSVHFEIKLRYSIGYDKVGSPRKVPQHKSATL